MSAPALSGAAPAAQGETPPWIGAGRGMDVVRPAFERASGLLP
eukprot:CAMPEP_0183470022 /NCGR_PEP_ID=MMETSP0370-20130417/155484_1 /TAXON_ID=268820 /ORGANISM="Peridinium aciculiferum, Strain PAER-2" /LENGTH=42 /DNA_ID= /DNA_START= /DNA_END= /DNA_ORIENTATION=